MTSIKVFFAHFQFDKAYIVNTLQELMNALKQELDRYKVAHSLCRNQVQAAQKEKMLQD